MTERLPHRRRVISERVSCQPSHGIGAVMPKVVVVGGGVAGMTVAHELAERGFKVVVLERRDVLGGKARSIEVPPGGLGGGAPGTTSDTPPEATVPWVPGEHGFRFFPGFYKHVI